MIKVGCGRLVAFGLFIGFRELTDMIVFLRERRSFVQHAGWREGSDFFR
jgi:hypothetical protein